MPPWCEQHQCFFKQSPFGSSYCPGCAIEACTHESVTWNPIEMEYQSDGTATVWQTGNCSNCGRKVTLNYLPNR